MKAKLILANTGCLLPFLIILNFFFGWVFLGLGYWLLTEVFLVLFFILTSYIMARRLFRSPKRDDGVIDVEGEVIEDKERHKIN
jgi:membrane protein implicated in regulation of membrane protease activity